MAHPPSYEDTTVIESMELSPSIPRTPQCCTAVSTSHGHTHLFKNLLLGDSASHDHSLYPKSMKSKSVTDIKWICVGYIPQWEWTNIQCRSFIKNVCQKLLNLSLEDSELFALKFEGFGTTLYMHPPDWWIRHLGPVNGTSVYVYLVGMRDLRGAVPWGVNLGHGNELSEGLPISESLMRRRFDSVMARRMEQGPSIPNSNVLLVPKKGT